MSNFKKQYPEFASIEHHIRAARAQRAVVIATLLADGIFAVVRGLRSLAGMPPAPAARTRAKPLVVKARPA
jgi:hypothetical protein